HPCIYIVYSLYFLQSSASSLSSGEYLPGSLQGKISSDGCLKKEQMVVSAIASTPQSKITDAAVNLFIQI
ncbi:hypothetical protein, partial [Shigella sonnei]|uniref:hypothetical protein n=1 Tax=Shigella sonnei TaxID=624 RepID=UPI001C0A6873